MKKLFIQLISFIFLSSCLLSEIALADTRGSTVKRRNTERTPVKSTEQVSQKGGIEKGTSGKSAKQSKKNRKLGKKAPAETNQRYPSDQDSTKKRARVTRRGDVSSDRAQFIQRFYSNILDRDADQDGLTYWLDQIQSISGARVALGFFNSDEFLALKLNDADFVNILYSTFFDREADEGGRNYWMSELGAGSLRELIVYGFLQSQEFQDLADSFGITAFSEGDNQSLQIKSFVQRFYQLVLNRNPDIGGFNDWSSQLSNKSKAGGEIAEGFFNSTEFLNRNVADGEFLDIAYRAFFDREADTGGKNNWLGKLSSGADRLEVIDGFIHSQEFSNLAASFGIEASRNIIGGGAVSDSCGTENFTVEILNSIQEGMSLDEVNRTIGCTYDPGKVIRVAGLVTYRWTFIDPSYNVKLIQVYFDSTGAFARRIRGVGPLTTASGF